MGKTVKMNHVVCTYKANVLRSGQAIAIKWIAILVKCKGVALVKENEIR